MAMGLVRRAISALYNGVSQQPTPLRLASQAEVNLNCYSSVVDGVAKRPPTQHVGVLSSTALGSAFVHTINRSSTEQYTVIVTNGAISVFAMDGTPRTVNYPNGTAYITDSTPATTFQAVTVADYTFIVNKKVVVAMKAVNSDHAAQNTTLANLGTVGRASGAYTQYGFNPTGSYVGQVQTYAQLPGQPGVAGGAPSNGQVYQVMGSTTSGTSANFGAYYVIYVGGVWNECVKPGLANNIDETTMPWALIRNSDGTFTFTPFSFKPRSVGDATTNPNPSFIGRTLRDVFFHKNRLGVTADSNVIFSASGDFGNFFRLTVLDLLASDVVDLAVSGTSVNYLNFAVPFYNNFMLFSDQSQFQLNVAGVLSPTTCSLDTVTQYQMSNVVRPVGIGSDVYFVSEKSNYATVWDYYIRTDVIVNSAEEITAHVPRYIPKGVIKLASSTERDMLFVLTTGAQSSVFVYKFFWLAGKKVQSAWSQWTFDASDIVLNCEVLASKLYLVIQRGTQIRLEFVDLLPQAVPTDLPFDPLLDNRVVLTGAYNGTSNATLFTFPYAFDTATVALVRGGAYGGTSGALIDPTTYAFSAGNTVITVPGNVTAGTVYGGENYNMQFTFSQFFPIDPRTGEAIETGRLQLRSMTVYYVLSAYFQTYVDSYGVGSTGSALNESLTLSNLSTFDAKTVGTGPLITGTPVFSSGTYSFTVMGDSKTSSITLNNNSPYMSRFESAEWEGLYWNRAQ